MKIKEIVGKRFNYSVRSIKDEEVEIVEAPFNYKKFDENGSILCDTTYAANGSLAEKIEFEYEGNELVCKKIFLDENQIAENHCYHYQDKKLKSKTIEYIDGNNEEILYFYDSNGNLISIESEEGEGGHEKMEYQNGKLTRHLIIDDFEEVEKDERRFYENEKLIRIDQLSYDEGELRTISTMLDDNSRIIAERIQNQSGKLVAEKSFEYSTEGLLTVIKTKSQKGEIKLVFEYDSRGNEILQEEFDSDEKILHRVVRVFNENSDVTEAEVEIFNYGKSIDVHYKIEYSYNYYTSLE